VVEGFPLQRAARLGRPIDRLEIVAIEREVLAHRHALLELEDVQLLRAAAPVLGFEAEVAG
jgi:hypothetical protein